MKSLAGKPEDDGTPPNAAQRGQGEARQFSPGRSLFLPEGPVLIKEKAVDRTQAVGQRIVRQERERTGGGEKPQQAIQNQQVHQGVQPTDQAKPQHLPRQAAPLKNVMRVLFDRRRVRTVR